MRSHLVTLMMATAALSMLGTWAPEANAELLTLYVDTGLIDLDSQDQPLAEQHIADGYLGFEGVKAATSATSHQYTESDHGCIGSGTIDVTIGAETTSSGAEIGTKYRTRDTGTELTRDLVQVGGDVFAASDTLLVTLAGLPQGEYSMTTYHLDSSASYPLGFAKVMIGGTEAHEAFQTPGSDAGLATATFTFEADGTNPVEIQFVETATSSTTEGNLAAVTLNAFDLQQVPEPTTFGLSVCGLLVLLGARRRRLPIY